MRLAQPLSKTDERKHREPLCSTPIRMDNRRIRDRLQRDLRRHFDEYAASEVLAQASTEITEVTAPSNHNDGDLDLDHCSKSSFDLSSVEIGESEVVRSKHATVNDAHCNIYLTQNFN
jgi:hypothetical protein